MSGAPPPPPPPPGTAPPRVGYDYASGGAPPPGYVAPAPFGGTPGWISSPGSNGELTIRAIREIRKGTSYYRYYLVLAIVAGLVSALVSIASGVPYVAGASIPASVWNGNNTTTSHGYLGSAGLAAVGAIAAGALALVVLTLILILIAWLTWRGGVKQLLAGAPEYGAAYAEQAGSAVKDYGRTVILWIVGFVVGIAGAAVLAAIILSAVFTTVGSLAGTTHSVDWAGLRVEVIAVVAVIALLGALFGFLEYYFASRSLKETLFLLASPPQRLALDQGRTWVLLGAAISFVSILSVVFVPIVIVIVTLGGLILLFLGFTKIIGVYDQWLAAPVRPGAPLAPA